MAFKIPEHYRLTTKNAKSFQFIGKSILDLVTDEMDREDGYFAIPAMNKQQGMMYLCRSTMVKDDNDVLWRIVGMNIPSQGRTPSWEEQHYLKKFFFDEEDYVIMVHPGKFTYVGNQTYWLHIFQPQDITPEQFLRLLPPVYEQGQYPFRVAGVIQRVTRALVKDLKETFTTKSKKDEPKNSNNSL